MYRLRGLRLTTVALGLMVPTLLTAPTAEAHEESGLVSRFVGGWQGTCDISPRICRAEGLVRIYSDRRPGSGALAICVGIQMHTANHRNLSLEPRTVHGQAVARVRPGRSKLATYKTVLDNSRGTPDHVHVVHTHAHRAGRQDMLSDHAASRGLMLAPAYSHREKALTRGLLLDAASTLSHLIAPFTWRDFTDMPNGPSDFGRHPSRAIGSLPRPTSRCGPNNSEKSEPGGSITSGSAGTSRARLPRAATVDGWTGPRPLCGSTRRTRR